MKTQSWIPDTHPNLRIHQQVDGDTITCFKVENLKDGSLVEGPEAQTVYEETLALNLYKNQVLVPAVAAASGISYEEACSLSYRVEDGELKADLEHIKDEQLKERLESVLKENAKPNA